MSTQGPKQPLAEKGAEIVRLRRVLDYTATCLLRTQWATETDGEYTLALAQHIRKELGDAPAPDDTGDYDPINEG